MWSVVESKEQMGRRRGKIEQNKLYDWKGGANDKQKPSTAEWSKSQREMQRLWMH